VLPAAVPYVLVPLAAISALALAGPVLASAVSGQVRTIYSTAGQGETRFTLWRNGLAAIESSPLFGLGPGAHSGYGGPHEGLEVHNTVLDWLGNTGFVGLSLFLAVLGWTAVRVLRRGSLLALGALVSLLSISAFHHVMRHPIFWLSLIVTANLPWPGEPERSRAPAPRPAPAGPAA
jgi:O-antigen ligase